MYKKRTSRPAPDLSSQLERTLIVAGATMLLSAAGSALACSCPLMGDWGFIGPEAGRLPANAEGVAWYSRVGGRNSGLLDRFTVEVQEGNEFRSIPAKVNAVGGFPGLYLVAPDGERMRPGVTYRFTVDEVEAYSEGNRQVLVTIDREELPVETPIMLEVEPVMRYSIRVSAGGSCSTVLSAANVRIATELGPAVQRWREQLLYRTLIDGGRSWHPTSTLCATVPGGRSWESVGRDRVYAACEASFNGSTGLARGPHTIKMQAILPGTNVVLDTPATTVDLNCSWLNNLRNRWRDLMHRISE